MHAMTMRFAAALTILVLATAVNAKEQLICRRDLNPAVAWESPLFEQKESSEFFHSVDWGDPVPGGHINSSSSTKGSKGNKGSKGGKGTKGSKSAKGPKSTHYPRPPPYHPPMPQHPVAHPMPQPVEHPVPYPIKHPVPYPVDPPVKQPVAPPVDSPVKQPVAHPVAKPSSSIAQTLPSQTIAI